MRVAGRHVAAAAVVFVALAAPGLVIAPAMSEGLANAGLLAIMVSVPALLRIENLRGLWQARYLLGGAIIAGTLAWDAWTAWFTGRRSFLAEWPVVYSTGLATFAVIYTIQVALASWLLRLRRG